MPAAAIEEADGMRQQTANKINTRAEQKRRVIECESGRPWEDLVFGNAFSGTVRVDSTVCVLH
jgi:hypothetical protein